jgi:long-chain acyl-CoA synthetase
LESWQQAAAEILNEVPQRNANLTYRELDRAVGATSDALCALGIRAGDRMMLVSELLKHKLAESLRK